MKVNFCQMRLQAFVQSSPFYLAPYNGFDKITTRRDIAIKLDAKARTLNSCNPSLLNLG